MGAITLQSTYSQTPTTALIGTVRLGPHEVTTMKNAGASLASMPIGGPVAFKPSGATSDLDASIPINSSDLLAGIVMHSDDYNPAWTDAAGTHGELDSVGVIAGALMNVCVEGWIWVNCITGCKPSDRLFVSYAIGGPYTAIGQFGNVTQASTTLDATSKGEWMTTATAGNPAWLKVDFSNK